MFFSKMSPFSKIKRGDFSLDPFHPFYHCTPEDQTAYSLQLLKKLNSDGIVQEADLKIFDKSLLELNAKSIQDLQALFKHVMTLNGRCLSIPLGIDISMQEIALAIHQAAQQIFNQNSEMLFDGGAIWKIIAPTVYRILESWWSDLPSTHSVDQLVTPFFKSILKEIDPNDYDWQFIMRSIQQKNWNKEIVNNGLVDSLAKKFKARLINPHLIELQLAKYKRKVAKLPLNSYISQVFKEHRIDAFEPNLYHIFIKAFGFLAAVDIEDNKQQVCFSLRTIGDSKTSHDCMFPVRAGQTNTPINSLFLNVTSLVQEDKENKIFLDSFINSKAGILPVLQGISDKNLAIFTFDNSKSADRADFARTMSFFAMGGRCYQKGWLDKIEKALEQEVKRQQLPLSKVVAQQLIDRVNRHHRKLPMALVVLTFNASAFLLWKNVSYKKEIQ